MGSVTVGFSENSDLVIFFESKMRVMVVVVVVLLLTTETSQRLAAYATNYDDDDPLHSRLILIKLTCNGARNECTN